MSHSGYSSLSNREQDADDGGGDGEGGGVWLQSWI
jgi:hypothetical protein